MLAAINSSKNETSSSTGNSPTKADTAGAAAAAVVSEEEIVTIKESDILKSTFAPIGVCVRTTFGVGVLIGTDCNYLHMLSAYISI